MSLNSIFLLLFLLLTSPLTIIGSSDLDKKTSFYKLLAALKNDKTRLINELTNEKHPRSIRRNVRKKKIQCYPITQCFNGKIIVFRKNKKTCPKKIIIPNQEHIEIIKHFYNNIFRY